MSERRASKGAAQRGDAPDEALALKILHNALGVINVRLAGDPGCSTDSDEETVDLLDLRTHGTVPND